jgi:hypothetical protein
MVGNRSYRVACALAGITLGSCSTTELVTENQVASPVDAAPEVVPEAAADAGRDVAPRDALSIESSVPPLPTDPAAEIVTTPRLLGSWLRQHPEEYSYCGEMVGRGAVFTWVDVAWWQVEVLDGTWSWTGMTNPLDSTLDRLQRCGVQEVGIHLLSQGNGDVGGFWATLPPACRAAKTCVGGEPSTAPRLDEATGDHHWDWYRDFVGTVAQHVGAKFPGLVRRWAVERDAALPTRWLASNTADDGLDASVYDRAKYRGLYFTMLREAREAIWLVDPTAVVEASVLPSAGWGAALLAAATDCSASPPSVPAAAEALYARYFSRYAPAAEGLPGKLPVCDFLGSPIVAHMIPWTKDLFDRQADYDVVQIHFFAPWTELRLVTDYVRGELAARGVPVRPLDLWRLGYGWSPEVAGSAYDPEAHARDEAKLLAIALGEGGLRAASYPYTSHDAAGGGHPGLYDLDAGDLDAGAYDPGPRPAARAFATTAKKIGGATRSRRLAFADSRVWGYRFVVPKGGVERTVWVLWATEDGLGPVDLSKEVGAAVLVVTDKGGKVSEAASDKVALGTSPVFLEVAPGDGG